MEPNSSTSDRAFLEELRRHRAELRESTSALEDALAAPATADHVRVHPGSADVLAHLVDHKDVQLLERQPGRNLSGAPE